MQQKINLLDLFSGIGGFHKGLEQAGFEIGWNGFSDIDKYANAVYQYQYKEAISLGSVTDIQGKNLPRVDAITFGSPCQDFSVAGRRSGLEGNRSSLISEAIRLIDECQPRFFIWENVKGTFSSNNGEDFWAIIQAFTNIGSYRLEWQLLNTRWFLPQNRERLYLVGCLGKGSGRSIFPFKKTSSKYNKRLKKVGNIDTKGHNSIWGRVYSSDGISTTLNSEGGGLGAKTGLYKVHTTQPRSGNPEKGGTGPLSRNDGNTYCLDTGNSQAVELNHKIRRLTPIECCRLQGFPDDWNEKGIIDGEIIKISDTQRYKQCGNAVTVNVVKAVGEKIYAQKTKPKNISKKS
jgi:DNA (cytosine-5)-methyltransferase 1|tara:strand:- start:256 stop:1296 length:1041 start_codon:yes stop_codon:yes gene_type:complete